MKNKTHIAFHMSGILIFLFAIFVGIPRLAYAINDVCLPVQSAPACGNTCTPGGTTCPQECSTCTSGATGYTCKAISVPSTCKCDGIKIEPTTFIAGQTLKIISYAKVEGTDTSHVTIPNVLFSSERRTETNTIFDIPYDVPIRTIINQQVPTKVRYMAVWSYTVPVNPDPNTVYKIRSVPECDNKTAGILSTPRIAEVTYGTVTPPPTKNFLSQLIYFIMNSFGNKPQVSKTASVGPSPKGSLQLDTLKVGRIIETDYCSYINFQFK